MIILSEFPFPPQSNNCFINTRWGGRRKSSEYQAFEAQVDQWQNRRLDLVRKARAVVRSSLQQSGYLAKVDMLFAVPLHIRPQDHFAVKRHAKSRVRQGPPAVMPMFTGKNEFRIWDVSNRIKAGHDALSKLLELPDHLMNVGSAEKVLIDDDGAHGVTVRITFHRVRNWSEAFKEWESR